MNFCDYLTQLFEYDRWANIETLERIGEINPLPTESLNRISHVVICQGLWLSRMTGDGQSFETVFPEWPLDRAREELRRNAAALLAHIAELPEQQFTEPFAYHSMEGGGHTSLRFEIFTQLILHGSYHRGQVGVELNRLTGKPLDLDFVYYSRKKGA